MVARRVSNDGGTIDIEISNARARALAALENASRLFANSKKTKQTRDNPVVVKQVDLLLGKPHAFQVILKGRALKVAAESAEDREKWMKCLRDCISAS